MNQDELRRALVGAMNEVMNEPASMERPTVFIDMLVDRIVKRLRGACPHCGKVSSGND